MATKKGVEFSALLAAKTASSSWSEKGDTNFILIWLGR